MLPDIQKPQPIADQQIQRLGQNAPVAPPSPSMHPAGPRTHQTVASFANVSPAHVSPIPTQKAQRANGPTTTYITSVKSQNPSSGDSVSLGYRPQVSPSQTPAETTGISNLSHQPSTGAATASTTSQQQSILLSSMSTTAPVSQRKRIDAVYHADSYKKSQTDVSDISATSFAIVSGGKDMRALDMATIDAERKTPIITNPAKVSASVLLKSTDTHNPFDSASDTSISSPVLATKSKPIATSIPHTSRSQQTRQLQSRKPQHMPNTEISPTQSSGTSSSIDIEDIDVTQTSKIGRVQTDYRRVQPLAPIERRTQQQAHPTNIDKNVLTTPSSNDGQGYRLPLGLSPLGRVVANAVPVSGSQASSMTSIPVSLPTSQAPSHTDLLPTPTSNTDANGASVGTASPAMETRSRPKSKSHANHLPQTPSQQDVANVVIDASVSTTTPQPTSMTTTTVSQKPVTMTSIQRNHIVPNTSTTATMSTPMLFNSNESLSITRSRSKSSRHLLSNTTAASSDTVSTTNPSAINTQSPKPVRGKSKSSRVITTSSHSTSNITNPDTNINDSDNAVNQKGRSSLTKHRVHSLSKLNTGNTRKPDVFESSRLKTEIGASGSIHGSTASTQLSHTNKSKSVSEQVGSITVAVKDNDNSAQKIISRSGDIALLETTDENDVTRVDSVSSKLVQPVSDSPRLGKLTRRLQTPGISRIVATRMDASSVSGNTSTHTQGGVNTASVGAGIDVVNPSGATTYDILRNKSKLRDTSSTITVSKGDVTKSPQRIHPLGLSQLPILTPLSPELTSKLSKHHLDQMKRGGGSQDSLLRNHPSFNTSVLTKGSSDQLNRSIDRVKQRVNTSNKSSQGSLSLLNAGSRYRLVNSRVDVVQAGSSRSNSVEVMETTKSVSVPDVVTGDAASRAVMPKKTARDRWNFALKAVREQVHKSLVVHGVFTVTNADILTRLAQLNKQATDALNTLRGIVEPPNSSTAADRIQTISDIISIPWQSRSETQSKTLFNILGQLHGFARFSINLRHELLKLAAFDKITPGRVIIKSGQHCLYFYIIIDGTCMIKPEFRIDSTGTAVVQPQYQVTTGASFGDFSLTSVSERRIVTVTSITTSHLLRFSRDEFKNVMYKYSARERVVRISFLRSVQAFEDSTNSVLEELAGVLQPLTVAPDAVVIEPGPHGFVYFVQHGKMTASRVIPFLKEIGSNGTGGGSYGVGSAAPATQQPGQPNPAETIVGLGPYNFCQPYNPNTHKVVKLELTVGTIRPGQFFPLLHITPADVVDVRAFGIPQTKIDILLQALEKRGCSDKLRQHVEFSSTSDTAVNSTRLHTEFADLERFCGAQDLRIVAPQRCECYRVAKLDLISAVDEDTLMRLCSPYHEGILGVSLDDIQKSYLNQRVWQGFKNNVFESLHKGMG